MTDYRRLKVSVAAGALLGLLCIIGVGSRLAGGIEANAVFLIGMWYNRVIMGLVIGLADGVRLLRGENRRIGNALLRGLLIGVLISTAVFLDSEFKDLPALFAGFAYGPIIDTVTTYLTKEA